MPEDFRKFAEKIGVYVAPGGKADIGTQIIEAQRKLTPTKVIPYRGSTHFVGRESELSLLHKKLQQGDYVAVAGMGGVGKTELATQYARRNEDKYGGIAWFNARETNLIGEVLQFFRLQFEYEIPQELGGRQLSLKEQVSWCWSKYPDSSLPILVVFDDITDLANFREVFPTNDRFRVLITTRLRNLDPSFIQEISLNILSSKTALELLQKLLGKKDRRISNELEAAAAICKFLEYLPLGIELVGAYLKEDLDLSLNDIFERLEEQKLAHEALQKRESLSSSQLGVKAAFTLTWLQLDPLTQQLGKLLSLFSPQSILWDLVVWVATKGGEKREDEENPEKQQQDINIRKLTWTDKELNEAKKQLYKRNLLQALEDKQGYYKIHSLVRWFLQEYLAEENEIKSVLSNSFATAMITCN